jgi:hypothetical protein
LFRISLFRKFSFYFLYLYVISFLSLCAVYFFFAFSIFSSISCYGNTFLPISSYGKTFVFAICWVFCMLIVFKIQYNNLHFSLSLSLCLSLLYVWVVTMHAAETFTKDGRSFSLFNI